ncbi:hypothetical protein AB6N24_06365 [Cellulomonas sp. 179-A 4D5 NHS]|uniref:hypothetical protein n=1 Tax=Cellulomonas sp. 179-A 4D5 NHS TaxID=3142378 RepID=UPI00399FABE1
MTVYYVDADARALLRQTGPGSSLGIADGTWVPLVSVESVRGEGVGVIRVGDRHKYVYDYDPSATDYAWWIQRLVTQIEPIGPEALAVLPARLGTGTP